VEIGEGDKGHGVTREGCQTEKMTGITESREKGKELWRVQSQGKLVRGGKVTGEGEKDNKNREGTYTTFTGLSFDSGTGSDLM